MGTGKRLGESMTASCVPCGHPRRASASGTSFSFVAIPHVTHIASVPDGSCWHDCVIRHEIRTHPMTTVGPAISRDTPTRILMYAEKERNETVFHYAPVLVLR